MQEPIKEELVNALPKDILPVTDASPLMVSQEAPLPTQRVGLGFIIAYAAAYAGTYMALLVPVIVTLALRIQQIDSVGKAGDLALVTAIGAIFSLLANPFFGRLSDRTTSRLGMRRPWLVGGAIFGTIGLLVIAIAPTILLVLVGWCLVQIAFAAVLTGATAVLPDQVPDEQRGLVSGVLGMTQGVGLIVGTFLEFLRSFWVNPRRYPNFGWAWLGRFLFFMGLATLVTYQVYYLIDHLHEGPQAVAGLIFVSTLVSTLCVIVASNLSGWLSDRVRRRKPFVIIAAFIYAIGLLFVALAPSFANFLIAIAIIGIGQGVYLAIDLALATSVLPEGGREAGKDLGVFNIASALPGTVAPAIAPIFLAIGGGGNYTALFIAAAVLAFLGALSIQPMKGVR